MLGDSNGYCKREIKYISHVQLQRLPNLPCLKRLWFICFPSSVTKCLCAKIRIGLFLVRIWHFTSKTFKKKLKLTTVCSCFFCNDPQKMFPCFFNELRGKMKLHNLGLSYLLWAWTVGLCNCWTRELSDQRTELTV